MIVVTGSARTGTSLMMQILKTAGMDIPAPAFEPSHKGIEHYNPEGFYEIGDHLANGVTNHSYSGQVVKLFGVPLGLTDPSYVHKMIICKRKASEAIKSSIPLFRHIYAGGINPAAGKEDLVYQKTYEVIEEYKDLVPWIEVHLESLRKFPITQIQEVFDFLEITVSGKQLLEIEKMIKP